MAFQHTMHARIKLRDGVTPSQIAQALQPLSLHFGWPEGRALDYYLQGDPIMTWAFDSARAFKDAKIVVTRSEDKITSIDLETSGEVGYGFCPEVLMPLAKNLGEIAEPGCLFFKGEENSREEFWFNASPDLVQKHRRDSAIESARKILHDAGIIISTEQLNELAEQGAEDDSAPMRTRPRG